MKQYTIEWLLKKAISVKERRRCKEKSTNINNDTEVKSVVTVKSKHNKYV